MTRPDPAEALLAAHERLHRALHDWLHDQKDRLTEPEAHLVAAVTEVNRLDPGAALLDDARLGRAVRPVWKAVQAWKEAAETGHGDSESWAVYEAVDGARRALGESS